MAGWLEKRGENKWRLNVPGGTGPDGQRKIFRRNVEAPSEREAGKLLALFASEVLRGQHVEPSKLTFKQFTERWLRDCGENNLAPKTLFRYRQILESRVFPAMGHLKIEDIKPLHLMEFYKNLREDGIRKDGRAGKLSDSSIAYHHWVISSILNDAVKWEVIRLNPASKVDPPKAKTKQAPCYNEEQTVALVGALDREPLKYKVMVILALATGLRRGELMGFEWPDVNFEANTVAVSRTSQYVSGEGVFSKDPKNETSIRVIAVPESVMALLKQHKAHQNKERLKVGDLWQGSDRIFTSWDGQPMFPNTISSWFPKFLARHKLPYIKFHAMRHTCATLLIAEGIPLKNVSARLGHADTRTTDKIYAHALVSVDKKAAQAMDNILTGKKKQGQA